MATTKDHVQLSQFVKDIPQPTLKMKQKRPQIKAVSSTTSTPRNLTTIVPLPTKPNHAPRNPTSSSSSSSSPAQLSPLSPATRIISSMKKPFLVSKRQPNAAASTSGMYSTPTECASTSRHRCHSMSSAPPTIEQIAMGLHTSRTPHLRPTRTHSQPYASPYKAHPGLPPPPARSSLKKPRTSADDSVPPNPTSNNIALVQVQSTVSLSSATASSRSSRLGFKSRISRLLSRPGSSSSVPSSSLHTPLSSPGESLVSLPPRKAVRFSQSVLELVDP